MPRQGSYSALPGQSTLSLPSYQRTGIDSADLSDAEGASSRRTRADETDYEDDDAEREGTRGLLSGEKNEQEDESVLLLSGKSRNGWMSAINCSLRTISLSLFSILILCLLLLLFHPSSPYAYSSSSLGLGGTDSPRPPSSDYYSGADLPIGTYDDKGPVYANPLPSEGKFGDIPFATVGGSKAAASAVPEWAGGDGGDRQREGSWAAEMQKEGKDMRWNGTHWFEPTVILISLDGVRADYLSKGLTPHLLNISRKGLRSDFLQPVFPSLTFVNHWSILTGLYPSSHGIVANDFIDPATGKEFVYTEPTKSWAPEWWGGEPIWSTAVKNGKRSAVLMWPGPPKMMDGVKPTYFYPFINHFHPSKKAAKLASWLDMPFSLRPHLITAYAPEVDQEGHRTGPHSHELEDTLTTMDEFAKEVYDLLEQRNLTQVVDVVFVSDHGMIDTHNERLVFLDDILGEEGFKGIASSEGWPSAGLRFQPHIDTSLMLSKLLNASSAPDSGFNVYTPETMPERWHFSADVNPRIAPLYVVPDPGWAISNREDFHVKMGGEYTPKGNHGYDPEDPSMHAIFCAHGPFASRIKSSLSKRQSVDPSPEITVIPGFPNLEIYDLVANLLGIEDEGRARTNGTEGFWEQYLL